MSSGILVWALRKGFLNRIYTKKKKKKELAKFGKSCDCLRPVGARFRQVGTHEYGKTRIAYRVFFFFHILYAMKESNFSLLNNTTLFRRLLPAAKNIS